MAESEFMVEQRMPHLKAYPKVGFVYFKGGRVSWSYHGRDDLRLGSMPEGAQRVRLIETLIQFLKEQGLVTAEAVA